MLFNVQHRTVNGLNPLMRLNQFRLFVLYFISRFCSKKFLSFSNNELNMYSKKIHFWNPFELWLWHWVIGHCWVYSVDWIAEGFVCLQQIQRFLLFGSLLISIEPVRQVSRIQWLEGCLSIHTTKGIIINLIKNKCHSKQIYIKTRIREEPNPSKQSNRRDARDGMEENSIAKKLDKLFI